MLTYFLSEENDPLGLRVITMAFPKKYFRTLLNAVTKSDKDRPREASYLSAIAVPDSVEAISTNICVLIIHSAL